MTRNRQWGQLTLFLMAVSFAVAAVMPTPDLDRLNRTRGELVSVAPSKNGRDTRLQMFGTETDNFFLVHGLSLAERQRVRSLPPGINLDLWYWDPPFGLELDVWQIRRGDEVIIPYQNRLHEFQVTQRTFLAVGTIFGIVALFQHMRSRSARKSKL